MRWFERRESHERDSRVLDVQLLPPKENPDWPFRVLKDFPFPIEAMPEDCTVRISGAGPVWMYGHLAALAMKRRARSIQIMQPSGLGEDVFITVVPFLECTGSGSPWFECRESPERVLIEFKGPQGGGWWPADVLGDICEILDGVRARALLMTGRGAAWMYAALAAKAVCGGAVEIACLIPRMGDAVCIYPPEKAGLPPEIKDDHPAPSFRALTLGVVGDPNSGKSLLAKTLDSLAQKRGLCTWCFDADLASRTQPWYLEALRTLDPSIAKKLRDATKRSWTPELEQYAAAAVGILRPFFQLVIVDLPGGNHATRPVERIPCGRESLFLAVDRFVILGKRGQDGSKSGPKWRGELARMGIEDRIVAELESVEPSSPPSAAVDRRGDAWVGEVRGLDRQHTIPNLTAGIETPLLPMLQAIMPDGGAAVPTLSP
jgi:hypothetical protein